MECIFWYLYSFYLLNWTWLEKYLKIGHFKTKSNIFGLFSSCNSTKTILNDSFLSICDLWCIGEVLELKIIFLGLEYQIYVKKAHFKGLLPKFPYLRPIMFLVLAYDPFYWFMPLELWLKVHRMDYRAQKLYFWDLKSQLYVKSLILRGYKLNSPKFYYAPRICLWPIFII